MNQPRKIQFGIESNVARINAFGDTCLIIFTLYVSEI